MVHYGLRGGGWYSSKEGVLSFRGRGVGILKDTEGVYFKIGVFLVHPPPLVFNISYIL